MARNKVIKTCACRRQTSSLDLLRRCQVYLKQAALKKTVIGLNKLLDTFRWDFVIFVPKPILGGSLSPLRCESDLRSTANPVNWWLGDSINRGRDSLCASLCAPAGRYKFNERHWRVYRFISLYKCFEQAQALAQKNETIKTCILIVSFNLCGKGGIKYLKIRNITHLIHKNLHFRKRGKIHG